MGVSPTASEDMGLEWEEEPLSSEYAEEAEGGRAHARKPETVAEEAAGAPETLRAALRCNPLERFRAQRDQEASRKEGKQAAATAEELAELRLHNEQLLAQLARYSTGEQFTLTVGEAERLAVELTSKVLSQLRAAGSVTCAQRTQAKGLVREEVLACLTAAAPTHPVMACAVGIAGNATPWHPNALNEPYEREQASLICSLGGLSGPSYAGKVSAESSVCAQARQAKEVCIADLKAKLAEAEAASETVRLEEEPLRAALERLKNHKATAKKVSFNLLVRWTLPEESIVRSVLAGVLEQRNSEAGKSLDPNLVSRIDTWGGHHSKCTSGCSTSPLSLTRTATTCPTSRRTWHWRRTCGAWRQSAGRRSAKSSLRRSS